MQTVHTHAYKGLGIRLNSILSFLYQWFIIGYHTASSIN